MNVVISGTGLHHPKEVISNEELVASFNQYVQKFNADNAKAIADGEVEALRESDADFIFKASGIKSRYVQNKKDILDPEKMWPFFTERANDELSMQAESGAIVARQAMKNANKQPEDIDGILVSCTHKQRDYPSIAIEIQNELGAEGFAFDMGVACSSATFGLATAIDMIKAGRARAIVVVTPEVSFGQVNYRDRDSHFIFGEAYTAVLVEREDTCQSEIVYRVLDSYLVTDYSNNIRNNRGAFDRCAPDRMWAPDKLFFQQGRKVFKEVTPRVIEIIKTRLARLGLSSETVKRYWMHQANANMNRVIVEKLLGKDYDITQAPIVLDEFANTAAAGSIIAMHRYPQGLQSKDVVVLCSFGAGYSIGSLIMEKI